MFCKWCGADLPNGVTKCKRCQKEVPALSDCGGFYDLVPYAKSGAVMPAYASGYEKSTPEQRPNTEPVIVEVQNDNWKKICFGLGLVCLTLLITVLILLGMNGKLSDEVERLDDRVDELEWLMEDGEPTETTEATGCEEVTTPAEKNVTVNVLVTAEGVTAKQVDPEEVLTVAPQEDGSYWIGLPGTEKAITFSWKYEPGTVGATIEIDPSLLGHVEGGPSSNWEYRDGEEFKAVDAAVFSASGDGNTCVVTYAPEKLTAATELRLTYEIGSYIVVISGISVTPQANV